MTQYNVTKWCGSAALSQIRYGVHCDILMPPSSSAAKVPAIMYQVWRVSAEMQNIYVGGPNSLNFLHDLEKERDPLVPKSN